MTDRVVVRNVGARGLSAKQLAIASGALPEGTTDAAFSTWLRSNPITSAASIEDAEALSPPAVVETLEVAGYAIAGDSGRALYVRVDAEPATHDLKFQSLDGQWWELADREITPEVAGAKGDVVLFRNGAIEADDTTLVISDDDVTLTAADIGKHVAVTGAGTAGARLVSTIASINGPHSVEIADAAALSVSGAAGEYGTDDSAAIQRAIDFLHYKFDGGKLRLGPKTYGVGATLYHWQRIKIEGPTGGFTSQYTNNEARPAGAVLFALAGLDADVLRGQLNLSIVGGVPTDSNTGKSNRDYRHGGVLRNVTIWGNRSRSQTLTAKDLNATGYGLNIRGARYYCADDNYFMYCAQDGLYCSSINYGAGSIASNNAMIGRNFSLNNAGDGFDIANSADSIIGPLWAGYNGGWGVYGSGGNSEVRLTAWNNVSGGWRTDSDGPNATIWAKCYDNNGPGCLIGTISHGVTLYADTRANGRDTGLAETERAGVRVAAGAVGVLIPALFSNAHDHNDGTTHQVYGLRVETTTNRVRVGSVRAINHARGKDVSAVNEHLLDLADRVAIQETFSGSALSPRWQVLEGSDGTGGATVSGGYVELLSGATASTSYAVNGIQMTDQVAWYPFKGRIRMEISFRPLASITGMEMFLGLTDQATALELPVSLSGATLTGSADNFVGVSASSAETDPDSLWTATRKNAGTVQGADSTTVLSTSADQTIWIDVARNGDATFEINGVETTITGAVDPFVPLYPVACYSARSAASRTLRILDFNIVQW